MPTKTFRIMPVAPVRNVSTRRGVKSQTRKRDKAKLDAEKMTKKLCQQDFKAAWKEEPKWRTVVERDHFGRVLGIITYKLTKAQFRSEWLQGRSICAAYL